MKAMTRKPNRILEEELTRTRPGAIIDPAHARAALALGRRLSAQARRERLLRAFFDLKEQGLRAWVRRGHPACRHAEPLTESRRARLLPRCRPPAWRLHTAPARQSKRTDQSPKPPKPRAGT